ncbi:N-acetyl-beta-D-galactosaminidase [Aureococcus anophagefferens]|nr:N-acetyl-beta-D-galactosaminidase [Aureococcus anophagefferens]
MEASNVFDVYGSPEQGGDERRLFVVTESLWLDAHPSNHLGHVFQPDALEQLMLDGSPLSPMLELRTRRGDVLGVLEGPTCWGGCCCGDPAFEYKASPSALLPRGGLVHHRERHWARDDEMLLDFHDGEPGDGGATIAVPGVEKMKALAAALLGHYAYFHHNRPGCELKGKPEGWRGPRCTLCAWSLFGHVCPCTCAVPAAADCHCARKLAKTRDDVDARLEQSEFHYARTRNPPPTRTSVFRRRASAQPHDAWRGDAARRRAGRGAAARAGHGARRRRRRRGRRPGPGRARRWRPGGGTSAGELDATVRRASVEPPPPPEPAKDA